MPNTILNFTIRADTAQATAEIKRVGTSMTELGGIANRTGERFDVSEKNFLRVAKSLGVDVSQAAERTIAKLEGLRSHLVSINAPVSDIEKVTRSLEAATVKYNSALTSNVEKMGIWQQHGTVITSIALGMAGAVVAFGSKAVTAFGESQKVVAQLDAVLKSTGGAAGITREQVLGLADALSKVTPFDDELIIQGENMLLTFTNLSQKVFPRAVESMLDLATAMGIDVVTAAKMLGKALDQPSEGLTALSKATGKFTDAEVKAIEAMVDSGKVFEAQTTILDKLDTKFKDSARAAGETFPGQMKIAQTAAGNFMEEVGSKLTPTLQAFAKEFPTVTAGLVGLGSAFGGLNISTGDLLIALPLMKTAFAGTGAVLSGLVASAGPIALAIAGIAALTATVYTAVSAFKAWRTEQASIVQAGDLAVRATDALTKKAAEYGIELKKGNETQEQFNARLFKSVAEYERLHPQVNKVANAVQQHQNVVKSHVLTLQEQIDRQRQVVERLKNTEGASEKLTAESAKLDAMLQKQAGSAQKAANEHEKLAKHLGDLEKKYGGTNAKILDEVNALKEDITFLEKNRGSSEALHDAKGKLASKTLELVAAKTKHSEILKKVALQELDFIDILQMEEAALRSNISAIDTGSASLERLGLTAAPKGADGLKKVDDAFKRLGVTTEMELKDQAEQAEKAYDSIRDSGTSSVRDVELAQAKSIEAQIEMMEQLGQEVPPIMRQVADELNSKWGSVSEAGKKSARDLSDEWSRQVSTIFTDLSKGIADAIVDWQGFGSMLKSITKDFGKAMLRTFVEELFKPLEKFAAKVFGKLTDQLTGFFSGKLGGGGGGGAGAGGAGGGGAGGGGVLSGLGIGALIAGGSVAVGLLINRLGRRGREKTEATSSFEDFRDYVWKDVYPQVEKLEISPDEGKSLVQQGWGEWVQWMNENLKDKTVIQRSIDSQKSTLDSVFKAMETFQSAWQNQQQEPIHMAEGGSGMVTKPTLFLAGEAGAERFSFEPVRGSRQEGRSTVVNMQPVFNNVKDPFEEMRLLDRMSKQLAHQLAR